MGAKTDKPPLLRMVSEQYGDSYREHILEIYKLYVDTVERVADRRAAANNYLLSVNAFLLTAFGFAVTFIGNRVIASMPIVGIFVCVTWILLTRSHRALNTAKFDVIHELETHLPVGVFSREWDPRGYTWRKWYNHIPYVEHAIPVIFIVLYIMLLIYSIASLNLSLPENPSPSLYR